jgi:hypothetical protein
MLAVAWLILFGVLEIMACSGTSLLHPFSLLVTADF